MAEPQTIFALSSAPGRAGVAVIRISGPQAASAAQAMAGALGPPRVAVRRRLRAPATGALLDDALVVVFPAPRSFTGEDVVELHVHGGAALVAAVLACLARQSGLRSAEPGEFTRRAFESGKLDLTGAEALGDLIDAETEAQRAQAIRTLTDGLGPLAARWRSDILAAMALTEAAIDFSDEGDVAADALAQARVAAAALAEALRATLADGRRGEILRDGYRVVIAGPPNAGKSSLLNALSRRDVAIVSPEAGTTRDVLEVRLDLQGIPVVFQDTAGLRDAPGAVEREGIRRALERVEEADLVLWVIDATAPVVEPDALSRTGRAEILGVLNKADLARPSLAGVIAVSAATGAGLPELMAAISARASGGPDVATLPPAVITRARQRMLLEEALAALERHHAGEPTAAELRAEDLRQAAHALGRLTGLVDAEEVLGAIFGRFCIGK